MKGRIEERKLLKNREVLVEYTKSGIVRQRCVEGMVAMGSRS